jgi:hypothetical protein
MQDEDFDDLPSHQAGVLVTASLRKPGKEIMEGIIGQVIWEENAWTHFTPPLHITSTPMSLTIPPIRAPIRPRPPRTSLCRHPTLTVEEI